MILCAVCMRPRSLSLPAEQIALTWKQSWQILNGRLMRSTVRDHGMGRSRTRRRVATCRLRV